MIVIDDSIQMTTAVHSLSEHLSVSFSILFIRVFRGVQWIEYIYFKLVELVDLVLKRRVVVKINLPIYEEFLI